MSNTCIARCDQLLQSEPIEIQDKVLEEIALERIITFAEHSLVIIMLSVVAYIISHTATYFNLKIPHCIRCS